MQRQINFNTKPPPEILRELAARFERGEIRSFYLCAVSRDGQSGNMLFAAPAPHYAHDLVQIGESAVQLCEQIDASLTPRLPGRA